MRARCKCTARRPKASLLFLPLYLLADLFAMLIIIPVFLAMGWVHKWRMG